MMLYVNQIQWAILWVILWAVLWAILWAILSQHPPVSSVVPCHQATAFHHKTKTPVISKSWLQHSKPIMHMPQTCNRLAA